MFRKYFIMLLLGHIVGHFYVQTNSTKNNNEKDKKWILTHSFYYWVINIAISIPVMSLETIIFATMLSTLHVIIDMIKYLYIIRRPKKLNALEEKNVFFIEQSVYFIYLITLAYLFVAKYGGVTIHNIINDFFLVIGVSKLSVASWAAALLIIHKPANTVISTLLTRYKPDNKDDDVINDKNAGRFIGTLERTLILIFISIAQYSAIGLVLTAKSIARYDRISKEKDFAEYYLLGTLLSTVLVIVVSFIL